jgi:hypothetical protein
MKSFLLIIISIIILTSGYSQENTKNTYAIVSIEPGIYDKPNKRYWCKIKAESIKKYSKEINNLINYSMEKNAVNTGASFYFEKNDTTSVYFNYFLSTTEAMQFLADHKWQLVTVNNEIISDYDNVKDGESKLVPVSRIYSRPVYYFKKETSE